MNTNPNENYKFIHHAFLRACDTALHLLQKATDFIKEKNLTEEEILSAKLYSDMFDFKKQIQVFTDNVSGGVARPAGLSKPSMPDTENSFSELILRVKKTKEFLQSVNPESIGDLEDLKIKLPWMPEGFYFSAHTYLGDFVFQNSMFHLVTAYDILRHKGVNIGKQDFTGTLEMKNEN